MIEAHRSAKRFVVAILALALSLLISTMGSGSVSAQAADESSEDEPASSSYTYTVEECDTLTHLARRTVQIEVTSNPQITLSEAARIYAENQLVAAVGERELMIGETVSFDTNDVKSIVSDASGLSEMVLANWEPYTALVNFDNVNSITPATTPPGVTVPTSPEEEAEVAEQAQEEAEAAEDEAESSEAEENPNEGALNDNDTPWYWWVLGAGAIGGVWYMLWNRAEEEE